MSEWSVPNVMPFPTVCDDSCSYAAAPKNIADPVPDFVEGVNITLLFHSTKGPKLNRANPTLVSHCKGTGAQRQNPAVLP